MTDNDRLPAGELARWIERTRRALEDGSGTDVPCDGCTACCRSSYFVHVAPDETDTLAHIPADLLFPAPGLPDGHVLMGHDALGRCPMLVDDGCSIYDHRPRTCRQYDCRVLAAAGLVPDGRDAIAERVRRWEFALPSEDDRARAAAVRAAAAYLRSHPECAPDDTPLNPPERLAVAAVRVHHLFLDLSDPSGSPPAARVRAALTDGRGPVSRA